MNKLACSKLLTFSPQHLGNLEEDSFSRELGIYWEKWCIFKVYKLNYQSNWLCDTDQKSKGKSKIETLVWRRYNIKNTKKRRARFQKSRLETEKDNFETAKMCFRRCCTGGKSSLCRGKTSSKPLGIMENFEHCVKSVRIRSYSGPQYLSVFRITPNTDTFHAAEVSRYKF